MGSMALQLKPFTVPDPIETYSKALTLRDMMDQRRYRALRERQAALREQQLQQQIAEEQRERQEGEAFQRGYAALPTDAPLQDVLRLPGGLTHGFKAVTARRGAETAITQAETARLTQAQKLREVQQGFREQYLNAVAAIAREKDPAKRAAMYPQLQQSLRAAAGEYLTSDLEAFISQPLPDDEDEILSVYAQVHGPEKLQELLTKRAAETRAAAEEARKEAAEGRAVTKEERDIEAAGRPTGTLREFKDVYYPGWLEKKGITAPTAANETAAYEDFRELLRSRIGGVPGVDVPRPIAVVEQEIDVAQRKGAATAGAKPPTEGERKAFGFYSRIKDAENVMGTLEGWISNLDTAGQLRLKAAPDWAQTEQGQLYKQALRQFTEARLRKESGAAIAASEYAVSERTYFPQPGDKPETLKRKAAARKVIMDAVKREAGRAYTETFGEEESPAAQGVPKVGDTLPNGEKVKKVTKVQ